MNPVPDAVPPIVRGLFLCDVLIQDTQTTKVSLINLFDRLRCSDFPAEAKPFVVYALLTNGSGEVNLTAEVESLDGLQVVYTRTMRVRLPYRVAALHVRFNVVGCIFPQPGGYQVVLYANGHPIAQTRLEVVEQE